MINWWNKVFFCDLKVFSVLISMLAGLYWNPLTNLRFENKTVLFVFQLWQLRDSVCTEIFEITEYLCYLGNNTSKKYFSPVLNLLFCY